MVSHRRFQLSKSYLFAIALLIGSFIAPWSLAADAVYSEVAADQHLREWLLLGPIAPEGAPANADRNATFGKLIESDLLADAGGESATKPAPDEKLKVEDVEFTWRPYTSPADIVDLGTAVGQKNWSVTYAAASIEAPEDESRLAGVRSDDAVRVWVNGERVHDNKIMRPVIIDEDIFPLKLKKGTNRLLIKVVNAEGSCGFAFRFLSPEGVQRRLFQAAITGNTETVEELAATGIDLNAKAPSGLTIAQAAKLRGFHHIADLLVSKGATEPAPIDPEQFIPSLLKQVGKADGPGVAVLVARDGQVLLKDAVGMADLSHDVPITTQTKFRIGSITKQFTAAAILKLQEEGRISVQDKLNKFFPDYPRGDEVTIHHLLTHTSGIRSFTSKPDFLTLAPTPATSDQMIEGFKNDPFDFPPETRFSYNNSGYFLLGVIIEKVSGKSFEDYLRTTFFEPLGMHDTGVHSSTAVIKQEALGYTYGNGKVSKALNWDMSRAGAAGNLYSTVEDLMRWNEGVFGGKVLSNESLEAAFTPVTLSSDEVPAMKYGYGWVISERRGLKTILHGGGLNGFSTMITRYVDQNTTIVVLHNALPTMPNLAPGEVSEMLADVYLGDEMKPQPRYQEDTTVDRSTFAAYVGRYDFQGAVLDVRLQGDQLTVQLTGQPRFPIFPMGKDKFFLKIVDAQVEFIKDENGEVVAASNTQNGQTIVAKRAPDWKAIELAPEILDRYVGKYEYPGVGVMTVRREGNKLLAQLTGQPELEIRPKAEDEFFWVAVVAEIKFVLGDEDKVVKAIHQQGGGTIEAKRLE